MQKSVTILLASSNDTLAFQSLQDPVQKWPSLFFVALVAPFQFLSQSLFFSAFFSASSSQLSTASPVMFYKPATVDESFLCAIWIGRLCLITSWVLFRISVANNFFFPCYFPSPCNSFINLVSELTLQTQDKIECHHFAVIKFHLLCCLTRAKNSTWCLINIQYIFVE